LPTGHFLFTNDERCRTQWQPPRQHLLTAMAGRLPLREMTPVVPWKIHWRGALGT
jgi:hypothetical protein